MSQILIPGRSMRQPYSGLPSIDWDNPLSKGLRDIVVPPYRVTCHRQFPTVLLGGTLENVRGPIGNAFKLTSATNNALQLTDNPNTFTEDGATDCTIFVIRRSIDTVARVSTLFGYRVSASDVVHAHAPYSDGNLYWDFGNSSSGSGRVSVAFTKSTTPDYLVFVAGGGKGREVWRNGERIVNNTGATAAISAGAFGTWSIGASASAENSDTEEIYLFGVSSRAWSDGEILAWYRSPWQLLRSSRSIIYVPPASSSAVTGRPQLFVAC